MIVIIDNYDSFTYNIVQTLGGMGAEMKIFRNDEVDISFIAPIKINIQDYMERIRETLLSRPRVTFRELTEGMRDRIELIVTFMAMLEMYKRDEVDIEQSERFGDIEIVRTDTAAAG